MKICQSCGMPMETEEMYGTNADGTKTDEYCTYCFQKGAFMSPDETMADMIETCIPFMVQGGMTQEDARREITTLLPQLNRWK